MRVPKTGLLTLELNRVDSQFFGGNFELVGFDSGDMERNRGSFWKMEKEFVTKIDHTTHILDIDKRLRKFVNTGRSWIMQECP